MEEGVRKDRRAVLALATTIITIALIYLVREHRTYVHIDAIAHVNKARGLWDNITPGLKQLGSIWLPLQHFLIAPLTIFDILWTTGLAGSLVSAACFVGTALFLYGSTYLWTNNRGAGWLAFLLFAFNPRVIYLFTTPMTEPLMVLCASGLIYFLLKWIETESWNAFAMASLMSFAGTLTRYEGWAIAAATIPVVLIVASRQRFASTILFTGASVFGPMLWMIYNMVYFEDPLIFAYGRGSARAYAEDYFLRTGKHFPTAGQLLASINTYWTDVAYCVNPLILWLALAGTLLSLLVWRSGVWRKTIVIVTVALGPFLFYVYNLYANMIPVLMPGLDNEDLSSIFNVRYGMIMAATVPMLAGFALYLMFRQAEQRRLFALGLIGVLFLPNPIPEASEEAPPDQLTKNLFYTEGMHNQSFWLPPFVDIAHRLKEELDSHHDETNSILTNTRIVHPTVWATGIHMKRFVSEMNKERWDDNLNNIDAGIRWVITEEKDQLWNAQGKILQRDWTEVAFAKTPYTGTVHLYRRR